MGKTLEYLWILINLVCTENLLALICNIFQIASFHSYFRRSFNIAKFEICSFKIHYIKGDSSLQATERFSDWYTIHHFGITGVKNILELFIWIIFLKIFPVSDFFIRASFFSQNFDWIHGFSQSLRVSEFDWSVHGMIFNILWKFHWVFMNLLFNFLLLNLLLFVFFCYPRCRHFLSAHFKMFFFLFSQSSILCLVNRQYFFVDLFEAVFRIRFWDWTISKIVFLYTSFTFERIRPHFAHKYSNQFGFFFGDIDTELVQNYLSSSSIPRLSRAI